MCQSDVNARRQLLKNSIKPRQERQNSRFKLLPEVRERCQKSKKIDARAYVNEGSLQGRSRWPKPFPKTPQISQSPRLFFRIFAQERPKSVPRAPRSAPRATKGTPRAEKYAKTRKNVQQPTKSQKNARKRTKITQNNKKRTATTWMGFRCR